MILTKIHYFFIALFIINGASTFSVLKPSAGSLQRSKVPLKTIFEDSSDAEAGDEDIRKELIGLLKLVTRSPQEPTALLLRINAHDYVQLRKKIQEDALLLPGSTPSQELQRAQVELLKKKRELEARLERIVNECLSRSTELQKTSFTAKKLIDLMHDTRFWDKKINYQIDLVIEECIKNKKGSLLAP